MANTLNLGKVTDFVTSVERVSGTGEAGSTDTYRMKTESGFTKDFNIVNGKDGISGLTYRKLLYGACTGGSTLTDNDKYIIRDIMIRIGEDLLTRGYKYDDVPSSDNTPATYLFVASGKDITYMTTDIQLDMWFADEYTSGDESRDHSWKTFKIGEWASGEIDYDDDSIKNVTGDLLKTLYAYNVYVYVLEPSKVSQKVQDFVDVASDQTITGQKTFTAHIKNDELDNTNGNAMVRYKSTENKVVLGGSTIPTTIMGSGDRPTYSKNGSDFSGNPLALKSDVDTETTERKAQDTSLQTNIDKKANTTDLDTLKSSVNTNWSLLMANLGIGRWANQTLYSLWPDYKIFDYLAPYYSKYARMFSGASFVKMENWGVTNQDWHFSSNYFFGSDATTNPKDYQFMFSQCPQKVKLYLPNMYCNPFRHMFGYAKFTHILIEDGATVKAEGYCDFFLTNATECVELGAIDLSEVTYLGNGAFTNCSKLKSIHCTHFKVSFSISASTAFEESDLVEIISNLDPVTSTQTLTMGTTNLAKLTDDEKKVATDKGWVLA